MRDLGSGRRFPVDGCQVAGAPSDNGAWLASFFALTGEVALGESYELVLHGEIYELKALESYACEGGLQQILAVVLRRNQAAVL